MAKTLSQIKEHNKRIGHFFFQRGNPPVIGKRGNFLVTRGFGNREFALYEYDPKSGRIAFVQHASSKSEALSLAKKS